MSNSVGRLTGHLIDDVLAVVAHALWPFLANRFEVAYGEEWAATVRLGKKDGEAALVWSPTDPAYALWLLREYWESKALADLRLARSDKEFQSLKRLLKVRNEQAHDHELEPATAVSVVSDAERLLGSLGLLDGDTRFVLAGHRFDAERLVARLDTREIEEQRERFAREILDQPEVDLRWMESLAGRPVSNDLTMYEPPGLVSGRQAAASGADADGGSDLEQGLDPEELLRPGSCVVLLGPVGAGKTTLLRHLQRLASTRDGLPATMTAVYERASDIATRLRLNTDLSLEEAIRPSSSRYRELIAYDLEQGRLILLLDGLDEVVEHQDRLRLREAVRRFSLDHPSVCIVATSRLIGYEPEHLGERFREFRVMDLDLPRQRRLVSALAGAVAGRDQSTGADLLSIIDEREGLRSLARSPLLITMIVALWVRNRRLPDQRAQVYDEVVRLLLDAWPRRRSVEVDPVTLRDLLQGVAYEMVDRGVTYLPEREVLDAFTARLQLVDTLDAGTARRRARHFLTMARRDTGAFPEQGRPLAGEPVYGFPHRSLLEYLAACALAQRWHAREQDFADLAHTRRWSASIPLLFGELSRWPDGSVDAAIRELLDRPGPAEKHLLGNLRLAVSLIAQADALPSASVIDEVARRACQAFGDPANEKHSGELLAGIGELASLYPGRGPGWVPATIAPHYHSVLTLAFSPDDDRALAAALLAASRGLYGRAGPGIERFVADAMQPSLPRGPFGLRMAKSAWGPLRSLSYVCGCGMPHGFSDEGLERLDSLRLPTFEVAEAVADPEAVLARMPCLINTDGSGTIEWGTILHRLKTDASVRPILAAVPWTWWLPLLDLVRKWGEATPVWVSELIEDLDDDSGLIEPYLGLLDTGPRRLKRHAAVMLGVNLPVALGGADDPIPIVTEVIERFRASGGYEKLLMVTECLGSGIVRGSPDDWVDQLLLEARLDPDPSVRAAAEIALGYSAAETPFPLIPEIIDWAHGANRPDVPRSAGIVVRLREAIAATNLTDRSGDIRALIEAAAAPPPITRGRTGIWPAALDAEAVALEFGLASGLAQEWAIWILGRLDRAADASSRLGPALRSENPRTRHHAATAIEAVDCRDTDWLEASLPDLLLEVTDDLLAEGLSRALGDALLRPESRRRVGERVAEVLDARYEAGHPSHHGLLGLAETLLLRYGSSDG